MNSAAKLCWKIVAVTFSCVLLLHPVPSTAGPDKNLALHGFVVYSRPLTTRNNKATMENRPGLFWESFPDHHTKQLLKEQKSDEVLGNIGAVGVDATGLFVAFLAGRKFSSQFSTIRQLWILRLKDNVIFAPLKNEDVQSFQWSPTGSRLAVAVKVLSAARLCVINPITGNHVDTNINDTSMWTWSPNSQSIAYVGSKNHTVYLYSLLTTRTIYRWRLTDLSQATLCFSSPETLLILQEYTIYHAEIGHSIERLSASGEKIEAGQASTSPTGNELAFQSYAYENSNDPLSAIPLGVDRNILVFEVRAQRFKMLKTWSDSAPFSPSPDTILGWSHDSRYLAVAHFQSAPEAGQLQITAIDENGESLLLFTSHCPINSLDWHEDH